MSDDETQEVTVEVDARIARRINDLAREFDRDAQSVARRCFCHGVRDYENALGLRATRR